jgi:FdhD protein
MRLAACPTTTPASTSRKLSTVGPSSNHPQLEPESRSVEVLRVTGDGEAVPLADEVAVEEPLEIRVRGSSIAVTMRTPGHDRELAAGFLLGEGLISAREDILEIAPCLQSDAPQNTLNVFLAPSVEVNFEKLTRHVFASSSCGVCGKATIEAVHQHFAPISSSLKVSKTILPTLTEKMRAAQATFSRTGGLHAAALFTPGGELLVVREDIGRHNAVDKVVGHLLLANQPPKDENFPEQIMGTPTKKNPSTRQNQTDGSPLPFIRGEGQGEGLLQRALQVEACSSVPKKGRELILLVSGRASFEILQKALAARIPIICAVSAPSSLAVEFARQSGQTLVGFLRRETMNIYAGAQRIE